MNQNNFLNQQPNNNSNMINNNMNLNNMNTMNNTNHNYNMINNNTTNKQICREWENNGGKDCKRMNCQ